MQHVRFGLGADIRAHQGPGWVGGYRDDKFQTISLRLSTINQIVRRYADIKQTYAYRNKPIVIRDVDSSIA